MSINPEYIWLIQLSLWLTATAIAVWVWALLRRSAKKNPDTWTSALVLTLTPPALLLFGGMGALYSVLSIAEGFPALLRLDVSPVRTLLVVVCMFWVVLRLITMAERKYSRPISLSDAPLDHNAVLACFRVARYVVIVVGILTAMDSMGFSISGLLAFGGVSGAVVAFAAKETLSNFFSGIMLFVERPFIPGDWIRCPGTDIEGVVKKIGWRVTQLETFDHRPLYVPNSLFSTNIIENPQRMTNRRIYENVGLRYDDIGKLHLVLADVRTALQAHPDIDQDKIQMVNFDNYGESSLNFFIYVMTKTTNWSEFQRVKEEVLLQVADAVLNNGAEFAFPTRTLHWAPPESIKQAEQAAKAENPAGKRANAE